MKDLFFKTIMLKGEAGGTIASIEKTSSALNVDTYTITLNDGETQTFEVTNGTSIASISKTGTSGLVDTYTITLTDGSTTTFEVTNGEDAYYYELPSGSVVYFDSEDPTPQGYEATVNPNGARIQAALDRNDGNLLFCGVFSNFTKSGKNVNGWTVAPRVGYTETSPSMFLPVVGLWLPANYEAQLKSPTFYSIDNNTLDGNKPYSLTIILRDTSDMSSEPIICKVENIIDSGESPLVDESFDNKLRVVLGTLYGGGALNLYLYNLTNSDLYISAIKFEQSMVATEVSLIGKDYGVYDAIKQEISNKLPLDISLLDYTATFTSGAASITKSSLGIGNKTINFAMASPVYSSGTIGGNGIATCQVSTTGLNIYLRDAVNDTIPADGDYRLYIFIAFS